MIERVLHLGCGEDIHPDAYNVDLYDLDGVDQTLDLNNEQWDLPESYFREIRAYHVFEHVDSIEHALRQCADLLEPGGELFVKLPIGTNAIADPDHERVWTWQTPEFYTGKRHWDTDVGLSVVDKSVSMHSQYPTSFLRVVQRMKWQAILKLAGPGEWCVNQPAMSGELTVRFRK